jgi:hypothetical protein
MSCAASPEPALPADPRAPERPFTDLDIRSGAPPIYEGGSQRRIEEVDRDCIIDHAAQSGRGHGPAVGAAILVEPGVHFGELYTEPARRDAELDPAEKPTFRPSASSLRPSCPLFVLRRIGGC